MGALTGIKSEGTRSPGRVRRIRGVVGGDEEPLTGCEALRGRSDGVTRDAFGAVEMTSTEHHGTSGAPAPPVHDSCAGRQKARGRTSGFRSLAKQCQEPPGKQYLLSSEATIVGENVQIHTSRGCFGVLSRPGQPIPVMP